MLKLLMLCAFLALFLNVGAKSSDVTFKNVVVGGYSMYTWKFNVTIESSNNLKEHLPKKPFDKLEIINSEIPTLYRNSISDVSNLDELILDNDQIVDIRPGTFSNVPELRKLVITNNLLEQINEGVFNNLNVATLDLSKNLINNVASGAFDNMPELLNVNLADNRLRRWDKNWFANTPLLTRVSFQNNLIEEIPKEAFKHFQGEKQFGSVSLTINIILSHNKIKKIHQDAFKGLDKINNLWLDNNDIDNWDENLLKQVSIKELRIDQNKLTCLNGGFGNIFVAQTTHIDGNPWDCECLKNIKDWTAQHNKDVIMYSSALNCDVERIDKKLRELNDRLKELHQNNKEDSSE